MLKRIVLVILATLLPACASAQSLTQRLTALQASHNLAGIAAARVVDGKIVEAIGVGCARFAKDGATCAQALDGDTALRVASISKLVVSVGVADLVRRGKIDLDRDINEYLGFALRNPAFPNQPITTRMLLSHTSSLRDGDSYSAVYPAALTSLLADPARFDSQHGPGSYFTYCNFNFGVIAQVIEKITGLRFDAYMQRAVFRPMDINAGYNWSGARNLARIKPGTLYRKKREDDTVWNPAGPWIAQIDDFAGGEPVPSVRGAATVPAAYEIGTNGTLLSPQGGLRISVRNLAKIAARLARDREPALAGLARPVWANRGDNGDTEGGFYQGYGSGPHLFRTSPAAAALPGHFAEAYGLLGGLLYDPETHAAWIYLITGFSDDPAKGTRTSNCTFAGLGPAETDTLCALFAVQPR